MKFLRAFCIFPVCGVLVSPTVYSLEISDALNAEQARQKQQLEQLLRDQPKPNVRLDDDNVPQKTFNEFPQNEIPCFELHDLSLQLSSEISGLSIKKFNFILAPLLKGKDQIIGRCVGEQGLAYIQKYAQNRLIEKGYITTQVIIQEQDFSSGQLVLTIIPGLINKIQFKNPLDKAMYFSPGFKQGDLLNIRDLEQSLEQLKRLRGMQVNLELLPSEVADHQNLVGYSDVVLNWQQNKKHHFDLTLDNSGVKSVTGEYQAALGYSNENLLGLNDNLYLRYGQPLKQWNKADQFNRRLDGDNLYVSYQIPYRKWLAAVSYSENNNEQKARGQYDEETGRWDSVLFEGQNQYYNANLSREIYRNRKSKHQIHGAFSHQSSNSYVDDFEILVQRKTSSRWSLGLDHLFYLEQGQLGVRWEYSKGTGAFVHKLPPELMDETVSILPSLRRMSRNEYWTMDINYQVPFQISAQNFVYQLAWRGQWTDKELNSQDKFSIGGRYTVRGFDNENILSGDQGHYLQHTFTWISPWQGISLYGGLDQGWVNGADTYSGSRNLMSSVFGVRAYQQNYYIDGFVGKAIDAPDFIDQSLVAGFTVNLSF